MNNRFTKYAWMLLALVTIGVFSTGLHGQMLFDDHRNIVENSDIGHLGAMISHSSRPLTELTFYLNYALHGANVVPYHVINILIHTIAVLLLFGIVLLVLQLPRFRRCFGGSALWLAASVALVWSVHPLNCESVTYIVHRAESMAGMFALLTVYAFLRSCYPTENGEKRDIPVWRVVSVVACVLGMLSKPIMVIIPLLVFFFDSVFIAGGFQRALRERGKFYLLLASTCLIPVVLVIMPNESSSSSGFGGGGAWQYLLTQCEVIFHYLRLSVWPRPLCIDYGWSAVEGLSQVWVLASILAVLVVISVVLLVRKRAVGFVGILFFLTLAPSSSFIPVDDFIAERRMYLPLIAVVLLVVLGSYWLMRRVLQLLNVAIVTCLARWDFALFIVAVVVGLSFMTAERNWIYGSEKGMWEDVLETRPDNLRAKMGIGACELKSGNLSEAKLIFLDVIEASQPKLESNSEVSALSTLVSQAQANLGVVYEQEINFVEAEACFRESLRVSGKNVDAMVNLGLVLSRDEFNPESVDLWKKALEIEPNHEKAHFCIGWIAMKNGHVDLAVEHLEPVAEGRGAFAGQAAEMLRGMKR